MRNKLFTLFTFCMLLLIWQLPASEKIHFWNRVQKGANVFNHQILRNDIRAAKNFGITFIRLAPDKFFKVQKDFLIGDADSYQQINPKDLEALKKILAIFSEEKMPVVITMLSLPGSRWSQLNNDQDDLRIWTNSAYQQQAVKFWADLAYHLKDDPNIIGYNILNEPHPERLYDKTSCDISKVNQLEVQQKLFNFYDKVISAIRQIDLNIPIILDCSSYGDPQTFSNLKIHQDSKILYSFHMYESFSYTNAKMNDGKYAYPGLINGEYWDKQKLSEYMNPVIYFQKKHKVASDRILVGEFGCHRSSKGIENYFQDLMDIFNENGWHYAFYAFREDTWEGMDYELGSEKLPWSYWQDLEKGKKPILPRKNNSKIFQVIQKHLK